MNSNFPTPETIGDTSQWRLIMRVDLGEALDVLLFEPRNRNTFAWQRFPISDKQLSPLKALQECIFSVPLLTCGDYMRVDCILANCRAVPLPPPLTPEQRALAYEAIFPDVPPEHFAELNIAAPSGADNAELVFMPDAETAGFLRRTFPGIRLHATLEPLCRYFALSGSRSIGARLYACFRRDMVDIMVFDRSCLLLANSFAVAEAADAAYYIMACARQISNTNNAPTIMASGNSPLRSAATDILRQCGANVMPAIFPSTVFSASTDAMDAPFDLIAMALCE